MQLHPQVHDRLAQIERIVIETQESGRAHHRQDRTAREPGRPRSLHPVHGRGPADLRSPDRRRLRGRGRERSAHRRAAQQDDRAREHDVHAGVLRGRQALHRQRRAGVLQGRHVDRARARRRPASAIAGAAPKACRCSSGNSSRAWPRHFAAAQAEKIKALFADREQLEATPVHEFVATLVKNS